MEVLQRQAKRAEIGVPIGEKLLLSVGELSVRKNHKVVVEALQSLPNDYWYVIVGKGDLKEELERADTTGRLKLLGFRTDIKELLLCSDLFVFPSLQEGLPVALMEAMSSGLNVVVSRIRGNSDLVEQNLTEPMDVEGWKKEILKAVEIYHCMSNDKVIQEFSILTINKQMEEIYVNILDSL